MVESAFDFLNQSRDALEKKPKYAVIHFATAIELILKARLMREHWSLLIAKEKLDSVSRSEFQRGEAKTVAVEQLFSRLENIAAAPIPAGAVKAFKDIAAHRNRMVHFFHEAASDAAEEKERAKVTAELLTGWFYLLRLVQGWKEHFAEFNPQMFTIEAKMRTMRSYLKVSYDALKPQIDEIKGDGTEFRGCPNCGYESARVEPVDDAIANTSCLVCSLNDTQVKMPCPQDDCSGTLNLTGWNTCNEPCDACGEQADTAQVAQFLDDNPEEYPDHTPKNCANCQGSATVVEHSSIFICTVCLCHGDDLPLCEWCNEYQLGYDLEFSYYNGCEFCPGHGGASIDD